MWVGLVMGLLGCVEAPSSVVDTGRGERVAPLDPYAFCEVALACEGIAPAPEVFLNGCARDVAYARDQAIALGCGEAFHAYGVCVGEAGGCGDGIPGLPTCVAEATALYACYGDVGTTSTIVPVPEPGTTGPTGGTDAPLAQLVEVGADCFDDQVVLEADFAVGAALPVIEVLVDLADTANAMSWYETHSLTLFSPTYALEFLLTGRYESGEASLFSCAPNTHILESEPGATMSYAWRIYDAYGLADCWALGHDPDGLLAPGHPYDGYGNGIALEDLTRSSCTVVSWSD